MRLPGGLEADGVPISAWFTMAWIASGSFQGPTLFLKGSLSDYIKTEDELKIRELFPQAHIETIADAGHWLQADQPVALAAALASFLNP